MSTLEAMLEKMTLYERAQFSQKFISDLDSKTKKFSGEISGYLTDKVFLHFNIISRVGFKDGKVKFSIEYDNIINVIVGPGVTYKNKTISKTKGKEFKISATKDSIGVEFGVSKSKQFDRQEIDLSDISDPEFGLAACKASVKKIDRSVTNFEIDFYLQLKEAPKKDQVLFSYTVDCGRSHKYRQKIPILIECAEVKSSCQAILAGILGHPKAGKSSFVNVLNDVFDKPVNTVGASPIIPTRTANYLPYQMPGDKYDRARPFELCDTTGKLFQVDNEDHRRLLKVFLDGVKDGTPLLSGELDPRTVGDPNKKITAAIIISSARWLLSTERPRWFFNVKKTKTLEQRMFPLCKLINYVRELLGSRKVVVVITHCDMVEEDDKELILRGLSQGIPEDNIDGIERNFIVFGQKECVWSEKDLVDFDNKLIRSSVDYLRTMTQREMDKGIEEKLKKDRLTFHIDVSLCKNKDHVHHHPFTELTKAEYLRALSILGVTLDPRLDELIKKTRTDYK